MKKSTLLIILSLFSLLGHSRYTKHIENEAGFSLKRLVKNNSFERNWISNTTHSGVYPTVKKTIVSDTAGTRKSSPTCPQPTALTVVSASGSSATLQWTEGGSESEWEIVVQAPGSGLPTASSTIIAVGSNPFTVTGLNPLLSYEYYVRAVCDPTDMSDWSGPVAFNLGCTMFSVPFTEGFNSSSVSQACWIVANENADADSWNMDYTTTPFEGNQSATLFTDLNAGNNNDWLISPTINLNSTTRPKRLKFHYKVQLAADPNNFRVVLSTTGPATANFTQTVVPLTSYTNTNYIQHTVNLVDASNNPLTGQVNIAWHVPSGTLDGNRLYIDNVIVEEIPMCPDPTGLTASSMGYTTATLNWIPGYNETQWEVIALPTGSPAPVFGSVGTMVTSPPPFVMNNLLASTTYDFYVRAICTSPHLSNWSGPATAATLIGYNQCSMPLDVPVNSTNQCIEVRNVSLVGSTVSSEGGNGCGTNNSGDIWFQFRATNSVQTIDLTNFTGTPSPIALTLYSGQCGSLNQIACSLNNSITATGLQINSIYLVRASLNNTTSNLNVQFNICIKTPQPPTNGSSLNCLINTVNYDFETPNVTGTGPSFPNDNTILGWRTTATDHIIEVWPSPNYESHLAYSGDQFIELNANQVSGVYQDYATPTSTVFNYGFAHKGRQGVDTVALLAGPPGGPYIEIARRSTGVAAWSYNTGSYTVPSGQTVTRFIFQSIASVGGATIGNFLDAITFTADNSIISASPLTLDCNNNTVNVVSAGTGVWSAHSTNPSATVIGNTSANTTTISGFSVTGIYKFSWTTLYCTSTVEISYLNNGNTVPLFTQVAPICAGETLTALPTTSNEGITGTWSPALDNTVTTVYTFTPNTGQCATTQTMTINVNPVVIPTFSTVAPICAGDALTALPTTSNEGITGAWSPVLDNTVTAVYTFTPDAGQCAATQTLTINVNPIVTPTFSAVAPICAGDTLAALPTTSNEGITGTWSPALDNTVTTVYTFTPDAGQCAATQTLTINVNPIVTPTFSAVAPICAGETLTTLPTTSNEGITGTWSPALDNTVTTVYTFTPNTGQCATTQTMTINVNPVVIPTFSTVAPICAGDTLAALPTTSNEGITGVWSPVLDNTVTAVYTFTPDAGQCAATQTLTINVNPIVTPTFSAVAPICAGDTLAALPTTSNEGITGTWSPALDNTVTTVYTFTPDAGQCAATQTLTINVNPIVTPTFSAVAPICAGETLTTLPTTSNEGIIGVWSPTLDNTATTVYTFTPDAGQCATTQTMTITVNPVVTPTFSAVAPICAGDTLIALPTTSNEGITGTWSPALDNTVTTVYTFTPTSGLCAATVQMTITVNPFVTPVFTQVAPICTGESLTALPTTSTNGITGTWSPALNNTSTTTYTFTPITGQCASTEQMTIVVNPTITPTFNFATVYCSGVTPSPLPTTSLEGITGTWSPAFNNAANGTYTFIPTAGQCAVSPAPVAIQITQAPVLTVTNASPTICNGDSVNITFSSTVPGTTYTWSVAASNIASSYPATGDETTINQAVQLIDPMIAGSITFDILPTANGCSGEVKRVEVIVNPIPVITVPTVDDTEICTGETVTIDVNGTPSGIVYHWQVVNATNAQVAGGVTSGTSTTGEIDVVLQATSTTQSGTIQFEITPVRNGCTGQSELTPVITVHPTPGTPIPTTVFEICTGGSTNIRVNVLPLVAGTNIEWEVVDVSNVIGATSGSGPIADPIVQQLTNTSTVIGTVTYRVKTELNGCYGGSTDYIVEVHPLPKVNLPERSVICIGENGEAFTSVLLDTGLSEADYAFDWTLNGNPIVGGSSILVDQTSELGEYSVIVTSTDPNNPSCPSDPVTSIVEGHTVGTIASLIPSVAFDENGSITVVMAGGTGGYLYALSPSGPWQESNVFTNLNTGNTYTVYVTDENGCTSDSQSIYLIGYPHFFTPNGDGANDTWNIWDLEDQPSAEIHIFDRYGKLIKQITPAGGGWDGTMNGQLLPSTDYWFTVKFIDPTDQAERVFKAHFSMKR